MKSTEFITEGVDQLVADFQDIADEFNHHVTDGDSVPSAPDSSKFRASRGGMIDVVRNLQVHGGQYGMDRQFLVAIKVGGRLDSEVHTEIERYVKHVLDNVSSDTLRFIKTSGTNWSAYGLGR